MVYSQVNVMNKEVATAVTIAVVFREPEVGIQKAICEKRKRLLTFLGKLAEDSSTVYNATIYP